jgi:hypothetical protein
MYCGWLDCPKRGGSAYPGALSQAVQAELVGDLGSVHGILITLGLRETTRKTHGQILLVGEDEQHGVPQLVLVQHALQLLAGLDDTVAIVAVDDEDDALGVLEVVPPQRADLVLPADIPHCELDVLVLDRLDIEAWRVLGMATTDRRTHQWWGWW